MKVDLIVMSVWGSTLVLMNVQLSTQSAGCWAIPTSVQTAGNPHFRRRHPTGEDFRCRT